MKSNTIKGVKSDYSAVTSAAQKQIKEKFGAAKAKIASLEKSARGYVSDNPKKAMAIAAGVGALIGAASVAYLKKRSKKAESEE